MTTGEIGPATTSQRLRDVAVPDDLPTRPLCNLFLDQIASPKRIQEICEPRKDRTSKHPGRNLAAATRDERTIDKGGSCMPARLRKHAPNTRPAEAGLYENATCNMTGLGRSKRDGSGAATWDQRELGAGFRGTELHTDVQLRK